MRELLICFAVFALAGCSTMDQPGGRLYSQFSKVAQDDVPVECQSACKPEWERAQLWLAAHSRWKLQLVTDVMLQTYSPVDSEVSYGFVATKTPKPDGYTINLGLVCGNPLGCDPSAAAVRGAFYRYVRTGEDVLAGVPVLGSIR